MCPDHDVAPRSDVTRDLTYSDHLEVRGHESPAAGRSFKAPFTFVALHLQLLEIDHGAPERTSGDRNSCLRFSVGNIRLMRRLYRRHG
jgi:hypothetical protein